MPSAWAPGCSLPPPTLPLSPDLVGQLHAFPMLHGPLVQLQHCVQLLQPCSLCRAPFMDKKRHSRQPQTHNPLKGPGVLWFPNALGQGLPLCFFICEVRGQHWWLAPKDLKGAQALPVRTSLLFTVPVSPPPQPPTPLRTLPAARLTYFIPSSGTIH